MPRKAKAVKAVEAVEVVEVVEAVEAVVVFDAATTILLVGEFAKSRSDQDEAESSKAEIMFAADIRHTDMVKKTTRLNTVSWAAMTYNIKINQNGALGEIAALTKEEYKANKAKIRELEGDEAAKAYEDLRQESNKRPGPIMRDIAESLLRLDTDEERARVQSLKDAAKAEKDAAKAEEAEESEEADKSGREKILGQLATIHLIIQGDEDAQYDILKLEKALKVAFDLLG